MSVSIFPDTLHHAYLIEGDPSHVLPKLISACEQELGVSTKGNPLVLTLSYDVLTVSHTQFLIRESMHTTPHDTYQVFFVSFNRASLGAQNALLKVLEEPTARTHFFLITRDIRGLLPTVLSRVEILSLPGEDIVHDGVARFSARGVKERMKVVEDLYTEGDQDNIDSFLSSLLTYVQQKEEHSVLYVHHVRLIDNVMQVSRRATGSLKHPLELLALEW